MMTVIVVVLVLYKERFHNSKANNTNNTDPDFRPEMDMHRHCPVRSKKKGVKDCKILRISWKRSIKTTNVLALKYTDSYSRCIRKVTNTSRYSKRPLHEC